MTDKRAGVKVQRPADQMRIDGIGGHQQPAEEKQQGQNQNQPAPDGKDARQPAGARNVFPLNVPEEQREDTEGRLKTGVETVHDIVQNTGQAHLPGPRPGRADGEAGQQAENVQRLQCWRVSPGQARRQTQRRDSQPRPLPQRGDAQPHGQHAQRCQPGQHPQKDV